MTMVVADCREEAATAREEVGPAWWKAPPWGDGSGRMLAVGTEVGFSDEEGRSTAGEMTEVAF